MLCIHVLRLDRNASVVGNCNQEIGRITFKPGVSSFKVIAKGVKLYLVENLGGLFRFQSWWGSDESNPFPFREQSPLT